MNYKVGIVSLGCAKNQVDAEMLLYTLKNRGFIIVNDPAGGCHFGQHLRIYRKCKAGKH